MHVGDKRMSLVLTREPRGEMSLEEIHRKSTELLTVSLRRFRSETPRTMRIGGFAALEFGVSWMHDEGPMVHRIALIEYFDQVLTLTVAGPETLRAQVEKAAESILASMKFRRPR